MIKPIIYTDRSNALLVMYMHDINKYPILSNDEINKLIISAQKGDAKAIDKICKSVLRFGITISKQYQNKGVPLMDLISECSFGIMVAIPHYNASVGVPFHTYATTWMRKMILSSIYDTGRLMRVPHNMHLHYAKVLRFINAFIKENLREPTDDEICKGTQVPLKDVKSIQQIFLFSVSLDSPINDDEDASLYEIIPSDVQDTIKTCNDKIVIAEINKILNHLPDRERDVLKLYFGIGVINQDLHSIATMFGLCDERARQLKEKALHKLKTKYKKPLQQLLAELS